MIPADERCTETEGGRRIEIDAERAMRLILATLNKIVEPHHKVSDRMRWLSA